MGRKSATKIMQYQMKRDYAVFEHLVEARDAKTLTVAIDNSDMRLSTDACGFFELYNFRRLIMLCSNIEWYQGIDALIAGCSAIELMQIIYTIDDNCLSNVAMVSKRVATLDLKGFDDSQLRHLIMHCHHYGKNLMLKTILMESSNQLTSSTFFELATDFTMLKKHEAVETLFTYRSKALQVSEEIAANLVIASVLKNGGDTILVGALLYNIASQLSFTAIQSLSFYAEDNSRWKRDLGKLAIEKEKHGVGIHCYDSSRVITITF